MIDKTSQIEIGLDHVDVHRGKMNSDVQRHDTVWPSYQQNIYGPIHGPTYRSLQK